MRNAPLPQKKFRPTILPDFRPSGLLELESNNKEGLLLKHVEPSDACDPSTFYAKTPVGQRPLYKLMVYRDDLLVQEIELMDKSSYVVGRASGETVVADIPIEEETCSKQHCVLQFRRQNSQLKAFLMDLESSNKTTLNEDEIPSSHYVQLHPGDVISSSGSQYDLVFVSS